MIRVISTGLHATTKDKCIRSVREQTYPYVHEYVEAGDQREPKGSLENFYGPVSEAHRDDIIVMLDGDDWLSGPKVLTRIAEVYEKMQAAQRRVDELYARWAELEALVVK